jgi:hypothetical protein
VRIAPLAFLVGVARPLVVDPDAAEERDLAVND